ncbi:hypothetical protein DXG01_002871 [Tephrocybe rancida]|nr:hypothetical protein DXG01_002871 [Tephrocybe rancida]
MPTHKASQILTQGTLSFGATKPKRTGTSNAKKQTKATPAQKRRSTSGESVDVSGIVLSSSDSEEEPVSTIEKESHVVKVEDRKTSSMTLRKPKTHTLEAATALQRKASVENRQPSDLNENDKSYNSHYAVVRQKMNYLKPIHSEGQGKIHEILRSFDMFVTSPLIPHNHLIKYFDRSYEYGPCVGVTRLERWERAEVLGLNPPKEVKEILNTRQGKEKYAQSVLFTEV